jgi:oligopeptide/dipeptide ABC transporter ATP-binding protein
MAEPLLEVEDLTVKYETHSGSITAVSSASFTVNEDEYYGIVGESGCGKSTIAKAIIGGLDDNGKITSGQIRLRGRELQDLSEPELNRDVRWKEVSYIPQSSMNSLDPLQRVSEQALEIADTHTDLSEEEALDRFREMFEIVGIPENRITDYPHQFSGGMHQRTIIALALFLDPDLIIADEPTTALDVIMQDQIFKYLDKMGDVADTSMILITHDISLVFEACERLAVMHGGQVAEEGHITDIYDRPRHPYSILLQKAFPDINRLDEELETIPGKPPQLQEEADYCTFADRCPWAIDECREGAPAFESVVDERDTGAEHNVACVRRNEVLNDYRTNGTPTHSEADMTETR